MSFMMRRGIVSSGIAPSTFSASTATFNGANKYFLSTGNLVVSDTDSYTIGFWIKNSSTDHQNLFSVGGISMTFEINEGGTTGKIAWCNTLKCQIITGQTVLNDGNWHKVHASYNDATSQLHTYIDGSEVGSSDTATGSATNGIVAIGRRVGDESQYAQGTGSSYTFWNSALSDAEILADYHLGVALCTDLIVPTPGHSWDLATYDTKNATDALVDNIGSLDLTNFGTTIFDGTGLTVECTP